MHPDLVIVGAGMIGSSCAYAAAKAGLSVTVIDRSGPVAGTTGAGEGNILVSDKEAGPELDLALWSNEIWRDWGGYLDADTIELEPKGGLVVAATPDADVALQQLARQQAAAGVRTERVAPQNLGAREPHLATDLAGGIFYPQDMQVQPMSAAARLLRASGARVLPGTELLGIKTSPGSKQLRAIRTSKGDIPAGHVVNAAGPWGGEVSERMGTPVPVLPRRGFILVTEPLPPLIRHKVYTADYVANVAASEAGLETSAVVEGTRSGTILIGASRERVGFDRTFSHPVLRKLAAQAIRLFPVLASARLIRAYQGFRPYCPDHLPVIGTDPRIGGVIHACGHEGAGIGLGPATGMLIASLLTGGDCPVDVAPFRPGRFVAC